MYISLEIPSNHHTPRPSSRKKFSAAFSLPHQVVGGTQTAAWQTAWQRDWIWLRWAESLAKSQAPAIYNILSGNQPWLAGKVHYLVR